ncbi:MAG: hypothetical protein ACPG49_11890 [Chitinophagales bacterium]
MPHYCRICDSYLPNEKFSGKGHNKYICKKCQQKPTAEITEIEVSTELFNYLQQSNISSKNKKRLRALAKNKNKEIAETAGLILELALIKPHKRKRIKFLENNNKDLLRKLEEKDLILTYSPIIEPEFLEDWEQKFYEDGDFQEDDLGNVELNNNSDELPF